MNSINSFSKIWLSFMIVVYQASICPKFSFTLFQNIFHIHIHLIVVSIDSSSIKISFPSFVNFILSADISHKSFQNNMLGLFSHFLILSCIVSFCCVLNSFCIVSGLILLLIRFSISSLCSFRKENNSLFLLI